MRSPLTLIAAANAYNLSLISAHEEGIQVIRIDDNQPLQFIGFFKKGHYCYLEVIDAEPLVPDIYADNQAVSPHQPLKEAPNSNSDRNLRVPVVVRVEGGEAVTQL